MSARGVIGFMHETKKLAFLDLTHSTEGFALLVN